MNAMQIRFYEIAKAFRIRQCSVISPVATFVITVAAFLFMHDGGMRAEGAPGKKFGRIHDLRPATKEIVVETGNKGQFKRGQRLEVFAGGRKVFLTITDASFTNFTARADAGDFDAFRQGESLHEYYEKPAPCKFLNNAQVTDSDANEECARINQTKRCRKECVSNRLAQIRECVNKGGEWRGDHCKPGQNNPVENKSLLNPCVGKDCRNYGLPFPVVGLCFISPVCILDSNYFMLGQVNLVAGRSNAITGVQVGLANESRNHTLAQVSFANDNIKGVTLFQLGLFGNYSNDFTFIQASFLGNEASQNAMYGVQIGGYFNHVKGAMYGVQINGLAGKAQSVYGVQIAYFVNSVENEVHGLQLGGGNWAGDSFAVQFGGINVADKSHGLQLGGINVAGFSIAVQFGGINFAGKSHGLQLGIINFTGGKARLQIGAINIALGNRMPILPLVNFTMEEIQ